MAYFFSCVFIILLSAIAGIVVGFSRPARRGTKKLVMGFAIGVGGLYLANYSGVFFNLYSQQELMLFTPFGAVGMFLLLWGAVAYYREPKSHPKAVDQARDDDHKTISSGSNQSTEQAMKKERLSTWQSRMAQFKRTGLYQVWMRARCRSTSVLWLLFANIAGCWLYATLIDMATPVLHVEEMNKQCGIFERWSKPRRSVGFIFISDSSGRSIKYTKTLPDSTREILNNLKGKKVTVYYQNELNPFFFYTKTAYEVEYDGNRRIGYDFDFRLRQTRKMNRLIPYLALATLLPLLRIWQVNRKAPLLSEKEQKGEK